MTRIFDDIMSTDTWVHDDFRFDFIHSNWVFVWFLLYFSGVISQSPLLVILIGIVANTIEFFATRKGKTLVWEIQYVFRNLCIKVLPAILILSSKDNRIKWMQDIIAALVVYSLFLTWVYINGALKPGAMNPFNFNKKE